jgi:hypothetical protein
MLNGWLVALWNFVCLCGMDGKVVIILHSVLLHVMELYHASIITTHENLDSEISWGMVLSF